MDEDLRYDPDEPKRFREFLDYVFDLALDEGLDQAAALVDEEDETGGHSGELIQAWRKRWMGYEAMKIRLFLDQHRGTKD
ncbi:MAG: hypothetical protein JNJ73_01995 [Hyphomonadaceae bacterium]|nr:hypothetical protein [Hyphomonadaceae bacterium]